MKQHTLPISITEGEVSLFSKVSFSSDEYNEDWIQNICFNHPEMLPIAEIEQTFNDMVPICRELSCPSGSMDLVYVNEYGFIAIGECKLWRNPEARRKVIGQILEYAKDMSNWGYDQFEKACLKARKDPYKNSLYDIVRENSNTELDEASFVDAVQRNLQRGRFVLLVIGDGIRESMEGLSDFIQRYGNMNFTLSLVELPIYKIPSTGQLIITPRIIAKTKEIERIIYQISDGTTGEKRGVVEDSESKTITEKVFFERLEKNIGKQSSDRVHRFIKRLGEELDVYPVVGRGKKLSLNLKTNDETYNFASLQETGEVMFFGIVNKASELGHPEIGREYLEKLAVIVGGYLDDTVTTFSWGVRQRSRKYFSIDNYLEHVDEWIALIRETIDRLRDVEED
ncbi:MAG: hypothetical protein JEY71_07350 [Sphaerochaeta sp.]|nr:hypothetical protein [Sphaerochaeta sp.]